MTPSPACETWPDIDRSVLAALLDLVGPPGPMSPRKLMGEPRDLATLSPFDLASLFAAGILTNPTASAAHLTGAFRSVALVLLDPRTNLTLRFWGASASCGEINVQFPSVPAAGQGVALNQIGRSYRISHPVAIDALLAMVARQLPPEQKQPSTFFLQASLPVAAAAALAALTDLSHEAAGAGSILLTAQSPPPSFPAEQICRVIEKGWALTGFCHLLTHVTVCSHQATPPSVEELDEGLQWLVARGLATAFPHFRYALAPELSPLVYHTRSMDAGIQWQRICLDADGALLISDRLFLIGAEGFLLSLQPGLAGRIFMRTETPSSIAAFLAAECEPPAAIAGPEAAPDMSPAAAPRLTPPPETVPPRQRTLPPLLEPKQPALGHLPHPAPPRRLPEPAPPAAALSPEGAPARTMAPRFCPQCGEPLKPGRRFCTACGAKTS